MAAPALEALFLAGPSGDALFALHHQPRQCPAHAAVLYLHPFAEELNKVRRMAAVQARALAGAGCAVLQVDLRGCGDSEGELEHLCWDDWLDDALHAARWLQQRHPGLPLWLWGARAGCLIAGAIADRVDPPPNLLFWAPVASGRTQLQQFLRIKLAGALLDGGGGAALAGLKRTLDGGGVVDVAGYRLPSALALGLDQAKLQVPRRPCRIEWLEVSSRAEPSVSPAAERWLDESRAAGHHVHAAVVSGPAFWQTTDIEEAPALVAATSHALVAPTES